MKHVDIQSFTKSPLASQHYLYSTTHGRLLALSLELMELLERQIAALDEQMRLLVEPLRPQIEQLDSIPGVDAIAARDMLGEIGTAMSRFGSAARWASWAKGRPGNHASAGTRVLSQIFSAPRSAPLLVAARATGKVPTQRIPYRVLGPRR